jgi:hypothetical protein
MSQATPKEEELLAGGPSTRPARRRSSRLFLWAEALTAPFRDPVVPTHPYAPGDREFRRGFVVNLLVGFLGSFGIFWGASQQSSPFPGFSLRDPFLQFSPTTPPAWFFGLPPRSVVPTLHVAPPHDFYLALFSFYCGMVLLMRAWIRLGRLARERPGIPVHLYWLVMGAWVLPMLFVAPLLSKDAYSYVAQGEMMSRHISPYIYGPSVLGTGGNSYTVLSDKLWWNTTSPYGPVFLGLAGVIQNLVGHSELGGLVLFRLVAVIGVGLIGLSIPRLARSYGRDGSTAFAYAVMNPIVLIHLIGGEHNDALMLGLLLAGLALARERHPVLGTVLVTLGALVKVPAIVGVVYIGWDWLGTGASVRSRILSVLRAGAISLVVMAAVTQVVGIGWGWVAGLTNPDTIRSYLDPVTGIGLGLGRLALMLGLGNHADLFLSLARGAGAASAVTIGLLLLWRSKGGASSLRAMGLTMLAVVVLGPVMQPWYLAWGVVILAPVASRRLLGALIWLTVVVTFLGVGDASYFVSQLDTVNPVLFGVASALALVIVFWPFVQRLRRGIPALKARGLKTGAVLAEETGGRL